MIGRFLLNQTKVFVIQLQVLKKWKVNIILRGRVDAMVAINNNSSENKYYVGLDFGYYFASDEKVKLTIDNSIIFEMDTFAQTAWINPSKNPNYT